MSSNKIRDWRKGRELAFQVLYSLAFSQNLDSTEVRSAFLSSPSLESNAEIDLNSEPWSFSWQIVHGVWKNATRLDECVQRLSRKWRVDRLGKIEHTLLRLGLYEILSGMTPPRVVMNEILLMADQYGAPTAKSFLNGILDAASRSPDACPLE